MPDKDTEKTKPNDFISRAGTTMTAITWVVFLVFLF